MRSPTCSDGMCGGCARCGYYDDGYDPDQDPADKRTAQEREDDDAIDAAEARADADDAAIEHEQRTLDEQEARAIRGRP